MNLQTATDACSPSWGDFARRLTLASDDTPAPLESEGILLIDEIDLHLHPGWQQRVVSDLQRVFPNVQIIATTHAPEVIASVPRENVFTFATDPEEPACVKLKHPEFQTSGMGCEDVLPLVMNVSSQPRTEAAVKLEEYYKLLRICEEQTDELRTLRAWLEHHFKADHPKMKQVGMMEKRRQFLLRLKQRRQQNQQ